MKFKTKHHKLTRELFHSTQPEGLHVFPLILTFINPFSIFIFKTSETTTSQCYFSILKQKMEMEEPVKEQSLSVGTFFLLLSQFVHVFVWSDSDNSNSILIVTWNWVMRIELYGGSISGNSARSKLLRYPLRSSSKFKESKPDPPDATISSASKRYFLMSSSYHVRLRH